MVVTTLYSSDYGSGANYTAAELGFPGELPPLTSDLPPGDGRYAVPHFLSFASIVQTVSRTYRYAFDEALKDSPANALAMKRDAVLWSALQARQRPTAQLSWHIDPRDESDPAEIEGAQIVTKCIEAIPRFQNMKMQLLQALWYGKYAVEVVWKWRDDIIPGSTILGVRDFIPVNGDKIRFKWDGTPGFLVHSMYPGTKEATDWGMAHFVTPKEREQYIIHQHEPDDPDWIEGDMAGALHGTGLRGRLYWFWWLKQQVFALLMNYLERFSNGLTIFYYAAHDQKAKKEAELAAQQQFSQSALLYPRWNKDGKDVNGVERLEVGTASPALLQNLCTSYFDMVMVRATRGESPYVGPEGAARGGGDMAELASEGLDETIKYDAVNLAETIQTDLVDVLYRYNCKGVRPGKFSFEVDTPNAQEVIKYAQVLYEMGCGLSEEQLFEIAQMQKPKPGDAVVSKIGAMQAAAIAQPSPEGIPAAGAPPGESTGQPGEAAPADMNAADQGQSSTNGYPLAFRRSRNGRKTRSKS